MRYFMLLLLVILLPGNPLRAEDTIKERPWSLHGYLKDMMTVTFIRAEHNIYYENLIHNRLNFQWQISPSFSTGAGMRNRFTFGNFIEAYPTYYDAFGNDNGVVDLSWNVAQGRYCLLNISFDRLWVDYTKGKFQVTAGRQRVNWGLNYVWNPNDIFNTYDYLDFDYEEKPGSDALRIQYYPASTGRAEVTVKAAADWVITAAALYQFNLWSWDFQFLGGVMDGKDLVAGAGWSGQIAKGGFRGELSYFHNARHFSDTTGIFTGSLGYDYTFRNSLMLQGEVLYNGNPNGNLITLFGQDPSSPYAMNASNPFLSDVTMFAGASYPVFPLLTLSLAGMWNWNNQTYIIIPSVTLSAAQNIDLMMLSQVLQVYDPELSKASTTFLFIRFKWSF